MRFLALFFLLFSAAVASGQAPGPATGLTATAVANKSIRLNWVAPAGSPSATGYLVFRAQGVATPEQLTAAPITSLTYTDSSNSLVVGTTYIYTVVAVSGTFQAAPSAPASASPVDLPGAPSGLKTTSVGSTTVSLAWNAVTGAVSYTLYRNGTEVEDGITGTTFTDVELTLSTTYSYQVTATSSLGDESAKSAPLSVTTFGDGTGRDAVWAKTFRQSDIDGDGLMTFEEYMDGHTARSAKVIGIHRFEYSDTDDSGDLTLTEYAKALGGKKYFSPTRPRQFYLADRYFLLEGEEADGSLTEEEFALTLNSRTPDAKVTKVFGKRDRLNPNGRLSEVEFGIRGGSDEDTLPVE